MKIIDNFLDDDFSKKLEDELTNSNFPWYCMSNITSDDNDNFAFFHQFVEDTKINSDRYDDLVLPLINEIINQKLIATDYKCERIKANLNPDLIIRGILLTMYDKRNKLSSQVEKEARDFFNDKVYLTVIPRNVRLSEAPSHGMPVLIYDKSCPGSKSYFNFTDEFINQEETIGSAA